MPRSSDRRLACMAFTLAAAGCGRMVPGNYAPDYFGLTVALVKRSASDPPVSPRTAVLWQLDSKSIVSEFQDQTTHQEADHIQIKVGIDRPPPSEAVHAAEQLDGVNADMRFALGYLVVYADDNNDHHLTFVDELASDYPDRVLAVASDYRLFYLAGGRPAESKWIGSYPVDVNFSLVKQPLPRAPHPGECFFDPNTGATRHCVQIVAAGEPTSSDEVIALSYDAAHNAALDRFACKDFLGDREYPDFHFQPELVGEGPGHKDCDGTLCPRDLPPAAAITECSVDRRAYTYKDCHDDAERCGVTVCHYGHGELRIDEGPPGGWPCP